MSLRLDDVAVYVMHGGRDPQRRRRLERDLERERITATWLTDVNVADVTPELRRRYYRPSRWLWWRRSAATERTPFRELTPQEVALAISHLALYEQLGAAEAGWSLVLEDDAVLAPGFRDRFDVCFRDLPAGAELVFIGNCCGLRVADVEAGRHFYRKDHPATKCTDSYLLTDRAAETVLDGIVPFVLPIDWELNHHLKRHDLAVYWLEPPLVAQGSEQGIYETSIR